ncbi:ABC transporter ATP-binding protein [Pararhodobacter sp. CCB-MM2]|uniref:ABC transporter ATP-binding protein n=1 Tax=Pararhodobacter sp. CCB-MM2 TaxID=1786003 RepID=UPI000834C030|nr:ABC transporter ATP-binding protein [Pararhodobacter sp. CCB-MM2]
MSLLDIQNLSVTFPTPKGPVNVVNGISFQLGTERLGIVGESGSGKSMTGRAILGLVRAPGVVKADRMAFEGRELQGLSAREMRKIRGARISMVMQDPKFSLNPVMTIGRQIEEALKTHESLPRRALKDRVAEMLAAVRIHDPERVMKLYPHEVSGGMGQRIMIAMMLIPRPRILIADEPTSALDVSVQGQVLDLIDELVREHGMGLMLVSHDLQLVGRYCDRVMVMNAGQVVETLDAKNLNAAQHPYTKGLLAAVPRMNETRAELPTLDRSQWAAT